ncbi:MAG TPA: vWA domain-containing protein [Sandaracinaceae bacterium]
MRRGIAVAAVVLSASAVAGCGSKSGLIVPELEGGVETDAGRDAGRDAGTDAGPDAGPPMPDECIELPYLEPPSELEVSFRAQILSADVFFLVDVTGSMGEEIDQIRARLRDEITPGLVAAIPDVRFGVGHFADFPIPERNYGDIDDDLFVLLTRAVGNVSVVQMAVDRLPLQGGRDGPEALVEALYLTATGEGFGRFAPPASCPPGTVGYPCFRADGSRIILAFTDAPSHNGPGGHDAYEGISPPPHTYDVTVNALRMIGAKVLGLYSGGAGGVGEMDLVALARDTGAIREDGTPIVFDIGRSGTSLGPSVVEAVRSLVEEVPIDVDVLLEDFEGDSFDALSFVRGVIADRAEPADGATNLGDRFVDVRPGTRVFFRIVLANDLIPQTDEPQRFYMRVVLRGDGVTRLQETLLEVLVPPTGGGVSCSI